MTGKEIFAHIENGGVFYVDYGKNHFRGTLAEYKESCQNIVDYMHQQCSYFDFGAIGEGGAEYPLQNGFKSFLKRHIA